VTSAFKLAWAPWVYGLAASGVGGGAAAISTGFTQAITDPQHSNLKHLLYMMGVSYIVGGILAAAFYLKQSPLPAPEPQIQIQDTKTTGMGTAEIHQVKTTVTMQAPPPEDNP
jgi:hypothetical protein